KELTKMQLDNQKEIAEMQNETQKEIAGIQSATSRQNTKDKFGLLLTALVLVAALRLAFMVRWTLLDTFAFLLLLILLLPSLLIMFIPSTFKRPVSSWKALNLRKTLLMASSVRLKPLNCSRLPCVYAQETLTFLLTQKKTCVKNYVQKE